MRGSRLPLVSGVVCQWDYASTGHIKQGSSNTPTLQIPLRDSLWALLEILFKPLLLYSHWPMTHIIHLLLQFDLGFGQRVDLVFLSLQVIQGLLMGLLQGFLLLRQLGDDLIQSSHLLNQVFNLDQQGQTWRASSQREEVQSYSSSLFLARQESIHGQQQLSTPPAASPSPLGQAGPTRGVFHAPNHLPQYRTICPHSSGQ